jgi:hypothetical protein
MNAIMQTGNTSYRWEGELTSACLLFRACMDAKARSVMPKKGK